MILKYIKLAYFAIIMIADDRINLKPRIYELAMVALTISPIAYLLKSLDAWFVSNIDFVVGFILIVIANALLGIWRHMKLNQFSWVKFLLKTCLMIAVVSVVYGMLSILGHIAGENFISNGFEVAIQVTTLLYPVSKALKSVHIISNGDYPPKWIMEKVYNYNNDGDLMKFFNLKNKENDK